MKKNDFREKENEKEIYKMTFTDKYLKITILFLVLVFLIPLNTSAQGQRWRSIRAGNWNTGGNWDRNSIPFLGFNWGNRAEVRHDMTFTGTLRIGVRGTVIVQRGVTLTITRDLFLDNVGVMIIQNGATVIVQGNVTGPSGWVGSQSNLQVDNGGTLRVTGSVNIATSNINYNWNGNVCINRNLTIRGNTRVTVNRGIITVGGRLTIRENAIMSGNRGIVAYGSTAIFSCGFSYLIANGRLYGDGGCGRPRPPAGGINLATRAPAAGGAGCGGDDRRVIIID